MKNTIMVNGKRLTCRIFDTGPNSYFDRYTVAYRGFRIEGYGMVYPYRGMSTYPCHPQGFGLWGESREFMTGKRLGKRISFDQLPVDCQKLVLSDLED
jgi:hypothetical protein